jgi:diguanylate cyclase (GGDEF)-like protein/PAS domain S-box-containing protein
MIKHNKIEIPNKNWLVFVGGWIGIIIGVIGVNLTDNPNWIKFFDNLHWTSGMLAAALLAWLGYRQSATPEIASARRWFALGFGGYAIGQLMWDIETIFSFSSFPAPSDFLYLCLGFCQLIGLIKEIRTYQKKSVVKIIFLDTLALSVAALTLTLALYLPSRGDTDILQLLFLMAYPLSLLTVNCTMLMMIPSLRLRISFNLILFVIASMLTAWIWMRWNLLTLMNENLFGDRYNFIFSIAGLLSGFSITFRRLEILHSAKWDMRCEVFLRFLPLFNVLLSSVTVIIVSTNSATSYLEKYLTIAGALAVILLAIIRQGVILKEREQLLLTQSLLGTVLDTVPLRIFWKDKNSQYLGGNTAFAQDVGLTHSDALIGKNDHQLNWHEQANSYQADDKTVMATRKARLNYEEPLLAPDGKTMWIKTSKVPLLNREGEVMGILGVYDDITQLKEYQDKLILTSKVFDFTQEGIMVTNADFELIDVNNAFCKITGYSREDVLGKNPRILKSNYHNDDFYQTLWQIVHAVGHWSGEIWNRRKNGETYPEWITISTITDEADIVSHYVGIFSDISHLKQHEKQLEHIAHYDALTGVPNRVLLVDRMKQAIAQTNRDQKFLAVCYLDMDGFKAINDGHGYHIGDLVLIKLAGTMVHAIREGDTLARLGGDEFVILLPSQENVNDCIHRVEHLLENIAQPIPIGNQLFTITASIGVTIYPNDNHEADALLRHADQAMYQAKHSGKNRYFLYDANADYQAQRQQQFMDEISYGLDNNQFTLFYQPKVAMTDRRVVGVEALIRWYHPQKGLLSPALFLPMIENSTLEIKLGDWVINHALAQMLEWQTRGHDISVSVNITGQQIMDLDFIDKLSLAFTNYPTITHDLLELEILETTALEIERSCAVIMTVYSELGVSFALDDFGTGYSTLTYLKQLPVSTLKVDQSFVRDMLEDSGDHAIVEGVIALAKVFGRKTVAEGVETEQHFLALQEMGCQIAQGYGIARPMSAKEFYEWYLASLTTQGEKLTA